jgi:hypothetical protein
MTGSKYVPLVTKMNSQSLTSLDHTCLVFCLHTCHMMCVTYLQDCASLKLTLAVMLDGGLKHTNPRMVLKMDRHMYKVVQI